MENNRKSISLSGIDKLLNANAMIDSVNANLDIIMHADDEHETAWMLVMYQALKQASDDIRAVCQEADEDGY